MNSKMFSIIVSSARRRQTGGGGGNWYNENWNYRKKITINYTKVEETLTNFPVYVDLSLLGNDFFSNVRADGGDIRITKGDGVTELAREIVEINTTAKIGELHFIADEISDEQNTEFYIYYGNSEAEDYEPDDDYGSQNVWDSDYIGVWHGNIKTVQQNFSGVVNVFKDEWDLWLVQRVSGDPFDLTWTWTGNITIDGQTYEIYWVMDENTMMTSCMAEKTGVAYSKTVPDNVVYDSTANEYHLTNNGTTTGTGKIGTGIDNSQAGGYLNRTSAPGITSVFTYEAWVNIVGGLDSIFTHWGLDNDWVRLYTDYGQYRRVYLQAGWWGSGANIIEGTTEVIGWKYVCATMDENKGLKTFIDGQQDGSVTVSYFIVPNGQLEVLVCQGWLHILQGYLDEFRISKTNRSAGWIATQYNNQNDCDEFLGVGNQESKG